MKRETSVSINVNETINESSKWSANSEAHFYGLPIANCQLVENSLARQQHDWLVFNKRHEQKSKENKSYIVLINVSWLSQGREIDPTKYYVLFGAQYLCKRELFTQTLVDSLNDRLTMVIIISHAGGGENQL